MKLRIKQLIESKRSEGNPVTQKQVAAATGVPEDFVSRYKRHDVQSIHIEYARKLADYFNVTIDELIDWNDAS